MVIFYSYVKLPEGTKGSWVVLFLLILLQGLVWNVVPTNGLSSSLIIIFPSQFEICPDGHRLTVDHSWPYYH